LERESNRLNQFDKGEIEDCQDALEFIRKLQKEFNDIEYNWKELAQPFEKQLELDRLYKDGLKYIKENNEGAAIDALVQIMVINPEYKDAIDYLYSAITENSIKDWQREIQNKCQEIEGLKQKIQLQDKKIYQLEHPQQLEPKKDSMVLEGPVEIQIPSNLEQVSYSAGGNRLAIACSSGGYIIDANSFSLIPVPRLSEKVSCVAFGAEDNIIFGSTQGDLIVCKSNENQYDFLSVQAHESQITSIAVSLDRKLIGSGSFDQKVKLWTQYENGYRSVGPVIEHNGWARSVKFSPDSTLLASGSEDGTVHLVDLESYEQLQVLECGVEAVLDIAFSPQGGVLAVTGASGNIEFWRIRDGQLLDSLIAHESWVRCIGYSEKGKELFSCSSDSTLVVWDAKAKTEIQRLEKHESQVMSFAISPTGEQLATIEWEGVALLWKIAG
jgi:WD40 repeat protein